MNVFYVDEHGQERCLPFVSEVHGMLGILWVRYGKHWVGLPGITRWRCAD